MESERVVKTNTTRIQKAARGLGSLPKPIRRWIRIGLTPFVIPCIRTYIRYSPLHIGKRALWMALGQRFAGTPRKFRASTVFGSKIQGNTSDFLQRVLYYFGIWEPHLTHWLTKRLHPGDTFVDLGANIGYYSLLASRLVDSSGTVISIEASPRIFEQLQANLALNDARNVRAINVAVAESRKVVSLFRGPEQNIGATTLLESAGFEFDSNVEAAPLSEILHPDEIRRLRIVKIDIEGTELPALQGMIPLIRSARSDLEIVVEVEPQRLGQQGKTPEDLVALLSDLGFHPYHIQNDWVSSYLPPYFEKRPERLRKTILSETLLVFSRIDAEAL